MRINWDPCSLLEGARGCAVGRLGAAVRGSVPSSRHRGTERSGHSNCQQDPLDTENVFANAVKTG